MLFFSRSQNFEMAKLRRDQISSVKYITSGWKSLSHLYQKIELQEDQIGKALRDLKTLLTVYFPDIKNISRFEAYDISNLSSKYFVGAMTVFAKNKIDSSHYRHFKIYSKETPDDQLMIKEVLYRRLKHPEWPFPDFILVDGGKPQVSAANLVVLDIPVIGLAKKEEIIVIKKGDLWHEIKLAKNSPALNLLQQLRDEAHRFANNYRKKLIQKNIS
jgi:excinuclease ABC subunit C